MKTSRAVCAGMLSSKNDDFKFFKNCEKHKKHVHDSSRARGTTVLSLQTSLSLTRDMNVKVAIELYDIFQNIETLILVIFR